MESTFTVHPIPADVLQRLRERGTDDHGNPVRLIVDEEGGSPLRCCLTESLPGEQVALIAYSPFRKKSPYAEVGAVFVHAKECGGYPEHRGYPDSFRHRRQIFRAYGTTGDIVGATLVEPGGDVEGTITGFLSDPEVDFVHTRNVLYGCYMLEIRRPDGARAR